MSELHRYAALIGLSMIISGYVLNEVFMVIALTQGNHTLPGVPPHSGPEPVGTVWLFLIPMGMTILLLSVIYELYTRFHKKDLVLLDS